MNAETRNLSSEAARALEFYRAMLTIRLFEETISALRVENRIRGSVHPYIGQEAIAVGVCSALRKSDYVASYHRGHGHTIAKGADPTAMMHELFGKKTGINGGKGGSMHMADVSIGMLGANGVIGDGLTMAVGAVQAARMMGRDEVAVAFIGDGGMSRGPLLETFNWAKVFNLPLLVVCEDNRFSYTTATKSVTGGPGYSARAAGFGLHAEIVDGNDVAQVAAITQQLVDRMRAGGGPAFLHAMTYRIGGHLATDTAPYRAKDEVARHAMLDPIARCEAWLMHYGLEPKDFQNERAQIQAVMDDAVRTGEAAPFPEDDAALTDVQDVGAPTWHN